ncbi:MAG: TetR/AcrR family transcriptional regulator [Sandaracinus sp.]|nr:TetR/AcrR family transcriptional regulator [Sandaracinus sp.]MCB9618023.1 TetR/AcrR family transcriptional regulator [Sandaracinus sp.]MCB9622242.1 TetR/AcrR family transcriptional regulator [Sandaracinus sp.]
MPEVQREPKQDRARRTREGLLSAAQRELSSKGYAGATAKSIAEAAGVATGSFYQYFADKDAVLRELAEERFTRIADLSLAALELDGPAPADPREEARTRMRRVVELVVAYHREDPGLHGVLAERRHHDTTLDAMTSAAERALLGRIVALLERWRHPGDHEATAFVLFQLVEGAVHAHCLGHPLVDDERFFRALVDAMVRVALV